MADQELPSDYDAIVLGTGMTECIIAAALSRIGWKVLHLDRKDYYSGDWASFNLEGLRRWIASNQGGADDDLKPKTIDESSVLEDGEKTLALQVKSSTITQVKENIFVRESLPEPEKSKSEEQAAGDSAEKDGSSAEGQQNEQNAATEASGDTKEANEDAKEGTSPTEEEAKKDSEEKAEEEPKPVKKEWSFETMKKEFRRFSIDLAPRVLYCTGSMVELLISSDIAKYCEFRTVTRVLTEIEGKLERVPCSRSDVFGAKQVSMIEKRMLMKLLTWCLEYDKHPEEYADYNDKPFVEFLKTHKTSANVQHYVHHAIAMATDKTSTPDGLKATQQFLQSLGRYGNTAFLWPLYGSGELPQCFCRVCAVFGGIYCLKRAGVSLIVDNEDKVKGVIDTEGQRLNAKHVIVEASYASPEILPELNQPMSKISRAVLLTDRSLLKDGDQQHISVLSLPPGEGQESRITVFELSSLSLACPKDLFVVHLSCRGVSGAEDDFKQTISSYFREAKGEAEGGDDAEEDAKPVILWSMYFDQCDTSHLTKPDSAKEGLEIIGGPDLALDFDLSIIKAREIFDRLCPGEEFLPKAPNPEDIIFDDGAQAGTEGSGFESEKQEKGKSDAEASEATAAEPSSAEGENTEKQEE